jgi:hypothetical protein
MKQFTLYTFTTVFLLLLSSRAFAQTPNLGAAHSFAVFTAVGAFENSGPTVITGDIGTNVGAFAGFPPGVVIGSIHVADAVSAQAAIDVPIAYDFLAGLTCGAVIGTTLGGGQILTPNIYCTGAATTLDGNLTLDAQGDPDAIFIFQIDGALATSTFASVTLINSASLCNVYWQVNGEFDLGDFSVFQGTLLVNGAINLLQGSTLTGRALSRAGAVSLFSNTITIGLPAEAAVISANGATSFCIGGSVILSGNVDGVWNTGATTPSITVTTGGEYFVTNTTVCGTAESNHIIVTVNPLPICSITGNLSICQGQTTELCATPGMAGYLWSTGATTACITVGTAGLYTVEITDANGCSSTCGATVVVNALPVCSITGNLSICQGQTTELCATPGLAGYLWSTGATTQCITVSTAGLYTVEITDANGCSSTCGATVVVNTLPVCSITGNLSICQGQTTELCATPGMAGYLWSTGATTQCITVSTAGLYTVEITDANGCSSTCEATVVVNTLPVCSITGNLSICQGQTTELCATPGLAGYLWSTGATTQCITVSTAGLYTVEITDANGCSSTCGATVVVNTLPVCSITGNLSICQGQTTELCATPGMAGYLWSTGATTQCITVSTAGLYTVEITDANGCSSMCQVEVIVNPPPVCNITGDLSFCQGQSTELCGPIGFASYLWSTGATTQCITVNVAGIYTLTVMDLNGCSSMCQAEVSVDLPPVCNITGGLLLCNPNQTTELCATPGAASYLWNTGATTACINVSRPASIPSSLPTLNGCSEHLSGRGNPRSDAGLYHHRRFIAVRREINSTLRTRRRCKLLVEHGRYDQLYHRQFGRHLFRGYYRSQRMQQHVSGGSDRQSAAGVQHHGRFVFLPGSVHRAMRADRFCELLVEHRRYDPVYYRECGRYLYPYRHGLERL